MFVGITVIIVANRITVLIVSMQGIRMFKMVISMIFFTLTGNSCAMNPPQTKDTQCPGQEAKISKWQEKIDQALYERRLAELQRRLDEFEKELDLKNSKK